MFNNLNNILHITLLIQLLLLPVFHGFYAGSNSNILFLPTLLTLSCLFSLFS